MILERLTTVWTQGRVDCMTIRNVETLTEWPARRARHLAEDPQRGLSCAIDDKWISVQEIEGEGVDH